jgi:hypothetical protein
MKSIFTVLSALLITTTIFAQAPQRMSYQAIVRNASNALVANATVGMRISILQTTATGTVVYQETQTPTTNVNGLVSISIGGGTVVSGNFSTINWGSDLFFIKTETDPAGGTSYTVTGTTQMLSVPYALDAKNAENFTGAAGGDLTGNFPNPTIGAGKVTVAKISASGTADGTTFLRGDGQWSTPSGTNGVTTLFTTNRNINNTIPWTSVTASNLNSSTTENSSVLSWIPVACTAKKLWLYNASSASVTFTLRTGTSPATMANTAMTITVGAGASSSVSVDVAIPAGNFISFSVSATATTTANVATALILQ